MSALFQYPDLTHVDTLKTYIQTSFQNQPKGFAVVPLYTIISYKLTLSTF
jgi:hypothetical protein